MIDRKPVKNNRMGRRLSHCLVVCAAILSALWAAGCGGGDLPAQGPPESECPADGSITDGGLVLRCSRLAMAQVSSMAFTLRINPHGGSAIGVHAEVVFPDRIAFKADGASLPFPLEGVTIGEEVYMKNVESGYWVQVSGDTVVIKAETLVDAYELDSYRGMEMVDVVGQVGQEDAYWISGQMADAPADSGVTGALLVGTETFRVYGVTIDQVNTGGDVVTLRSSKTSAFDSVTEINPPETFLQMKISQ